MFGVSSHLHIVIVRVMDIEFIYVNIKTWKIVRQFRLRILKIFFGQFGHPIGGNGMR